MSDLDDLDDDITLVTADPVGPDPVDPPVVIMPRAPQADPLAGAAWHNVVTLMETQNAIMEKSLRGLNTTLEALQDAAGATQAAAGRVNTALEKLEEKQAAAPDDLELNASVGVTPPPAGEERKKGPRWRK